MLHRRKAFGWFARTALVINTNASGISVDP